jgi:hypothetical protein
VSEHTVGDERVAEPRVRAIVGTALLLTAVGAGIFFADPLTVGALIGLVACLYLFRAAIFSWPGAALALVVVICLVPARRYTLPVSLPFAAEPYRIVVVLLLAIIVGALLVDPAFRWRRLEFGGPVGFFFATQLVSIALNVPGLVDLGLAPNAVISLFSLLVICAVFVVARQIFRSRSIVRFTLMATVLCGALVGALATVERVTRRNVFLDFFSALPLQRLSEEESLFVKEGTARAFASAQHPIALAVFLCLLIPLGVYLARHANWPRHPVPREFFWLGCTMLIALGMVSAARRHAARRPAVASEAAAQSGALRGARGMWGVAGVGAQRVVDDHGTARPAGAHRIADDLARVDRFGSARRPRPEPRAGGLAALHRERPRQPGDDGPGCQRLHPRQPVPVDAA